MTSFFWENFNEEIVSWDTNDKNYAAIGKKPCNNTKAWRHIHDAAPDSLSYQLISQAIKWFYNFNSVLKAWWMHVQQP